ncbi:MAG: allantoinase [Chloroflexaceae bacterium]|nr:allantoinase [Chloroflexaceae bacterium]
MAHYDLIVRGGLLVLPIGSEPGQADIGIIDGQIAAIAPELTDSTASEINAHGLVVLPGAVDAHIHCNEPGRTEWEGLASGTRALAAGGVTSFFDMPLNSTPPTTTAAALHAKHAAAQQAALVDYALWGGLVPGNLADMAELAAGGVIGFKAFMSNTGTDDFQAADDLTLYEGMQEAARLGCIVAVHAENNQITHALTQRFRAEGKGDARAYLNSRPVVAELEAIERAITFASETGCALHIVHVSTGRGVSRVVEAQARGVDVSCETCAHYLYFTEDDLERLGAVAKCAPPLRSQQEQAGLWAHLAQGTLAMVTSDHSPAPPNMKTGDNMLTLWGGISGCQSTVPAVISAGYHQRGLALPLLARALATYPAERFGLAAHKGQLAVGADADLALLDLYTSHTVQPSDLFYRHQHSPYIGQTMRCTVVCTLVRGTTVYQQGQIVGTPGYGRLLTPAVQGAALR